MRPREISAIQTVKELMLEWTQSIQDGVFPYRDVTIDEQLLNFYGRCPIKQYMPPKPGKYGIKLWLMVDSLTSYVLQAQVYSGKIGNNVERSLGKGHTRSCERLRKQWNKRSLR
jgi:hypothetical protein